MSASNSQPISRPSKWSWSFRKIFLKALASPWVMVTKVLLFRKTYMVSRVTSVIVNGAKNIQRVISRWRGIVSQLWVTIWLVVFLICYFLLGMAMKMLPIKGQTGMFKSSIMLSNLVLSIVLVCWSVQALNSFVSEFTLLTRKRDKLKYIGKKLLLRTHPLDQRDG